MTVPQDHRAGPMRPAEVRWRLLVSAAEDYTPLVHALWEFGIPADPLPGAPTSDDIKAALWGLIEEGLVDLFVPGPDGEPRAVAAADRPRLFITPSSWEVGTATVLYSSTAAGDEAVRTRPPDVPEIDWSAGS